MAISGDGSQATPYLVSTIKEISEAFTACRAKSSAGTYYVKLTTDIHGGWSEWPLDLDFHSDSDRMIDFDMDGHEICDFTSDARLGCMAKDTFRNGKIYNIYRDSSTNYILSKIKFVRMSVSAFVNESKSEMFPGCEYEKTALWLRVKNYNAQSGYVYHPLITFNGYSMSDPDGPYQLKETDMKVIIDNVNTAKCVILEANSASSPIIGETCRIQGQIANITPASITEYPAIMSSDVAVEDSVVNMELPNYTGTVSSSPTTIIGTGTTGVINSDLVHDPDDADYTMLNLIPVTDTEMHSAADLTDKGFPVYDISPS